MRVVADTNVVVSGLLWRGPPRQVLDAARRGLIQLFTSPALLSELQEVLGRKKFVERLKRAQVQVCELTDGYAALAAVVQPSEIPPVSHQDPDDDAVVGCAVAARASAIVTGDGDFLTIRHFRLVEIVTVNALLLRLRKTTR